MNNRIRYVLNTTTLVFVVAGALAILIVARNEPLSLSRLQILLLTLPFLAVAFIQFFVRLNLWRATKPESWLIRLIYALQVFFFGVFALVIVAFLI